MENIIKNFMENYVVLGKSGLSETVFKVEIGLGNKDIVIVADNEDNDRGSYVCQTIVRDYTEQDVKELYNSFDGDLEKYLLIIQ